MIVIVVMVTVMAHGSAATLPRLLQGMPLLFSLAAVFSMLADGVVQVLLRFTDLLFTFVPGAIVIVIPILRYSHAACNAACKQQGKNSGFRVHARPP
jgi:uncharacterized membrane protein YjjP (DUF1212 family)